MSSKRGVRNLQEAGMDKLQQRPPDDIKLLKKYLKNGTNLLNIPIVVLDGDLAATIDMSTAAEALESRCWLDLLQAWLHRWIYVTFTAKETKNKSISFLFNAWRMNDAIDF